MNFFKKNKEIEIITPLEGNLDVQAFAEQYAKAGTIIEVKVHGSLYQSDGNMVSVRFITKEKWMSLSPARALTLFIFPHEKHGL